MNKFLRFTTLFLIITACSKKDSYNPERFFSKDQQQTILRQIVYYSAKRPFEATEEEKFNPEFDSYYDRTLLEYDFRNCAYDKQDSGYYFLVTFKAISIWPARVAIGGKIKITPRDKIVDYEEMFRTWKMTDDTLRSHSLELFNTMVQGGDLTRYEAKYMGDRYIEFPDEHLHFDKD
jgi:hypothetical protein